MQARTVFSLAIFFAALFATATPAHTLAAEAEKPQYYELRVYSTKSVEQQKLISDYWENAGVPAYNRQGIKPIGVFTELTESPTAKVYVLIPCDSLEIFQGIPAKLAADAEYQKAAAEYLNVTKNSAAFERIESSLNVAFDGMKKLEVPPSAAEKKPWVFELRTYQSPSEGKGINKVAMFNAGEIAVMKEVGLSPVFFSQTIVGSQMPNLTYMVSGESLEEHKKHFGGFGGHPIWKKLNADPQYKDNVSKIISIFLKRTDASQI